METTRYKLKDILIIKNGKDHSLLEAGDYPVIGSGGVMRYANQYLYNGESVLLPRKGTLDNIQYINGSFWTVDTCYYTEIDTKIANPYYLYRHLRSLDLSGLDSGASIPSMTSKCYYGTKIDLPNIDTQKRIADILSAYDDLIENNNRRIEILEKTAQELYKEWFVRFRFPGHEMATFENGLPKGWVTKKLFDIANVKYGYAFKSDLFCEDETLNPVVRIRDIPNNKTNTFTSEECDEKYIIKENAIVIGMDGIFHMCLWNGGKAFLNQRVVEIESKIEDLSNLYLYYALHPQVKYWEQTISGTTVAHLGDKHLKIMTVIMPNEEIAQKATAIFNEIMIQKNILFKQNQNLIKQSDLLLPRLMSGKLEV